MKLGFIALALSATFATNSYAFDCNTVMGGCPTDSTQVTSAHMRSDITSKSPTQQKPLTSKTPAVPASASNTATQNKPMNNRSNGQNNLMQTLNKNVLK